MTRMSRKIPEAMIPSLLVAALVAGGCSVSTGDPNSASDELEAQGYEDAECPKVDEPNDGDKVVCSAIASFADGSKRRIKVEVTYSDCTIRTETCRTYHAVPLTQPVVAR